MTIKNFIEANVPAGFTVEKDKEIHHVSDAVWIDKCIITNGINKYNLNIHHFHTYGEFLLDMELTDNEGNIIEVIRGVEEEKYNSMMKYLLDNSIK